MAYDVAGLLRSSQKELDALFRASEAGPIPSGDAAGTAIIAAGSALARPLAALVRVLAWQGKSFDSTAGQLKNRILPFGFKAIVAKVYKAPSWLDEKECIVLDYSKTSLVARPIRDEIRMIKPKLYLGKVYWGRTRLIDFALEF